MYAQSANDTLQIHEVEITATREKLFSAGSNITEIDSIIKANSITANLSELLSENSTAFIKSYGSGGIATIAFRGTEARHTSVLWNGFNINSPTLGLCDLALVPVNFADKITVVHGSASSLFGTSAIGGIINLQNIPEFFTGLKLNYTGSAGSFGSLENVFSADAGIKNFLSSTHIFYEQSKNDFPFTNFYNQSQKQQHANVSNTGVMQNFYFRFNNSDVISSGIWYQVTDREISPLMTVPQSTAQQKDSVLRIFLEYKKTLEKTIINFRAAYFDEYELYSDPYFNIYAPYKNKSVTIETEERFYITDKLILNAGGSIHQYKADVKEYKNPITQNYSAAFAGLRYDFKNGFQINCDARKDFTENRNSPVAPSAGIEKTIFQNLMTLKVKGGKNFNLPSLNDLYWVPGGNRDLKPETGWSYEGGIVFHPARKNKFSVEATYFSTLINDWIQWQPGAFGYYTPMNLKQVHARGIESSINLKTNLNKFDFYFSGNYSFTKSTNEKSYQILGEETISKQLIYVPEHLANVHASIAFKKFTLTYSHIYVSSRFTTSDNILSLPFYHFANLNIEKYFILNKNSYGVFFKINNLFDENYQVIAYRAMPGRNYSAGIKINLNYIKSSNHENN
ncbi:MAG: TonB-dependent receptor [Bacteroidota bacterium]